MVALKCSTYSWRVMALVDVLSKTFPKWFDMHSIKPVAIRFAPKWTVAVLCSGIIQLRKPVLRNCLMALGDAFSGLRQLTSLVQKNFVL